MLDKEELLKKVRQIAFCIKSEHELVEPSGILVGASGLALFCFQYAKFFNEDEYAELGTNILINAFEQANKGLGYSTYCLGLAGAGWTLDYLRQQDFIELDTDELLSNLDLSLYHIMIQNLNEGNYDLLHGALGYGFYFLKRYQSTNNVKLKERYQSYLSELVLGLKKISENSPRGIKWQSVLKSDTGEQVYNFGLSHGMSSIINLISRVNNTGIERGTCSELLKGASKYILSYQRSDCKSGSLFQNYVPLTGETNDSISRIAWCYGDLGIGLSLRHAGLSLGNSKLVNASNKILEYSAKRKTDQTTKVKDAGVCHGSFGNAQIFNRLYVETGNKVFGKASVLWILDGLGRDTFKDGYAGYKQYNGKIDDWERELNLLEGVAGIGLTILSFLSGDNSWDECLLIGN